MKRRITKKTRKYGRGREKAGNDSNQFTPFPPPNEVLLLLLERYRPKKSREGQDGGGGFIS